MKLSAIVRYLNHLRTLSVKDAISPAMAEVTKITHTVQHSEIQAGDHAAALISIQENLETSLKQYEEELKKLRGDVQGLIEQKEPEYFLESTTRYQENMKFDTPDWIINRTRALDTNTEKLLYNRLTAHTSWQYPGMVIRPAHCPGLESLVALDPLYLVDTHQDLLSPIRSLFTPEYQRRLQYYVIKEYTPDNIFWNLPQTQFGFVYAFHYFEYKPLEIILQYLDEIFLLLRPGGTFLFSFNDCDQWRSVGSVEHYSSCYTPGRLIRQHIHSLNYKIVYDHRDQSSTAWLELRKPGELDSIRGGQALASVVRLPQYIDEARKIEQEQQKEQQKEQYRLYWKRRREEQVIKQTEQQRLAEQEKAKSIQDYVNELNLDKLIHLAEILNVDISQDKTKREFNIKKVRRTISVHIESMNYSEEHVRRLVDEQVIDKSAQDLYNALDLDRLIKLAAMLKIDISEDTVRYLFDFGKVHRTISIHLESMNYSEEHLRRLFNPKENP